MLFNIGDLVTRKSHNNDMAFKIIDINGDNVILKGVNIRLIADALLTDLVPCKETDDELTDGDRDFLKKMNDFTNLDRDDYFYLPGKILHIDADKDYLDRCMKFYKKYEYFILWYYLKRRRNV